ncbi:MAG: hypothetical protein C0622_07315 [Desulfuromonas sp.]|nr:MAG: hypothetical protein C0622_07315 [Desulfuromonas sp.]
MTTPIDEKACPLCGNDNGCKMHTEESCWCNDVTFPQGLIDRVPPELQRKACICRACVDAYLREHEH